MDELHPARVTITILEYLNYSEGESSGAVLDENRLIEKEIHTGYADFLNTKAEFLDPNAMQLQTACSMSFLRPVSGT